LAPLPDEPENVEGEEDEPEDDNLKVDSQIQSRDISEAPTRARSAVNESANVRSPKAHPLATTLTLDTEDGEDREPVIPPPEIPEMPEMPEMPEIILDPLGPSEAPHLEPLNEDDLGVLGIGALANPDPTAFDIQNGLNVVDADTVMKEINEETLGAQ
jgi:hypothetical protein